MDNLITTNQLCAKLGLSRMTIERWRKEGMPYIKLGVNIRFDLEKVMIWINENKGGNYGNS